MENRSNRAEKIRAYVSILLAAALWGAIGLWNRQLMAGGFSPLTIVGVRNFGGMVLLTLTFAVKDRSVFKVERRHLKYFFGTGVVSLVLFTMCYFTCQKLLSLAVSSVLLYTAPSFVVLLSAVLWREPVTGRKLAALALTLAGCALVCGIFSGDVRVSLTGVLLGLGSGFFYALYSIFSRYALNAGYSSISVTVWTFLFAGPVSLFLLRPEELAHAAGEPRMWLLSLGLAVFATVLPYLFYTAGLAKVESGRASIMASLEPVVASLIGTVVLGEPMTALTALGIVLVLSGVAILR